MLTRIILKCTAFIAITPSAYQWACHADIAIALLHKEHCHREMIRDAAEALLGKFGFNITIYGGSKREKEMVAVMARIDTRRKDIKAEMMKNNVSGYPLLLSSFHLTINPESRTNYYR
jgi:hypothetical protein